MKIANKLQAAYEYFQAGNLENAEILYKKVLKIKPDNIDALHNLGILYYQRGDYDSAIKYIRKELQYNAEDANAYNNLGLAYEGKGQLDEAVTFYREALQLDPNLAIVYYNLGNALKGICDGDEAIACYQKALQLEPHLTYACNNLGIVQKDKGNVDEAITYFQRALKLDPNLSQTWYNLGLCYHNKRLTDDAMACFQKALQLNPYYVEAYCNLGTVLQENGCFDKAVECYQKAIHLDHKMSPQQADANCNLGIVFQLKGLYDDAITFFRKALQIDPDHIKAYNNLGIVLQKKGLIEEAITCYKKALQLDPNHPDVYNNLGNACRDNGKLSEAEQYLRMAVQLKPDHAISHSNILLLMNYDSRYNAQAIFQAHLESSKQLAEHLSSIPTHDNVCEPGRRLRIGYVSPDFRRHSVAYFIEPVLLAHNREHFEIFCYSDVPFPDDVTKRIEVYADQWRYIVGMSDEKVFDMICGDKIDILIDLAGHTAYNRMLLFACKPAPVQVSWIGYPATVGLSAMNYKIVDKYTDPPGMTEQFYTEQLMRMPESFLCYLPYNESPEVGPLPILERGHITFGSFNFFAKMSPEVFSVWGKILKEVPESHLVLKTRSLADKATRRFTINSFAEEGVGEERIELFPIAPSIRSHLDFYNRVDIGLDTFPYNGTTTTCEALWMGVPVITLEGLSHVSRVGVSLLSNVGLHSFIAKTEEEYIEKALHLANDIDRLQMLRRDLRSMIAQSTLCNRERFTSNLEDIFRSIWKTWCEHR